MVDRINIVTLIILLFLSVGRAFVRAGTLMVVNSVMQNPVIKPDEWREVYRWVLADKNVPDRKEVLMLSTSQFCVLIVGFRRSPVWGSHGPIHFRSRSFNSTLIVSLEPLDTSV